MRAGACPHRYGRSGGEGRGSASSGEERVDGGAAGKDQNRAAQPFQIQPWRARAKRALRRRPRTLVIQRREEWHHRRDKSGWRSIICHRCPVQDAVQALTLGMQQACEHPDRLHRC